jgi:hypothetical protein
MADQEEKDALTAESQDWIYKLTPFVTGVKKWDTGCIWVCESHPFMPYEQGYSFDCTCGGPGMPPLGVK